MFRRNIAPLFLLTVFVLASVGLFWLIGGSRSFFGPEPEPATWSSEQNTVVVTWYIENAVGDWSKYEKLIYAVLEDERGWQKAGIDFKQVYNAYDADIVIRMYDRVSEKPCGEDDELLRACAMGIGLHLSGNAIYLPAIGTSDVFTFFVNHEFGHRLGFFHRDTGLMRKLAKSDKNGRISDEPMWPTDTELRLLREMFESGRKTISRVNK